MSVVKILTNFNIEVEFETPEFYKRLIALIIDIIIQFFYYKIAIEILRVIARNSVWDGDTFHNLLAVWTILWVPIIIYHPLLEITMNGQSIGKKIMSLKIVNENGGRPSISQYLIRWFLRDIWFFFLLIMGIQEMASDDKAVSVFIILFVLAYFITDIVLVVSSKKGQRIGDILAHTILIRTDSKASIEETVFEEVADTYIPSFPQIMQLSDKDINAIKSILETARKKGDFNMAATAGQKIKSYLKIDSSLSPFDFLDTLLKDYNYLSVK